MRTPILYHIILIVNMIAFQGCQTFNHLAFEWKYRKDYKVKDLPLKESILSQSEKSIDSEAMVLANDQSPAILPKRIPSLSEIEPLNKYSQKNDYSHISKLKIYKRPELPPAIIDTPPPSDGSYYNSYEYTGTNYKKVPTSARVGFIFSLTGLIPIYGFLLAVGAIILGSIGLSKIIKHKDRYRGLGFAITAVVLGVAIISFYVLLIYLLATNDNSLFNF